MFSVWQTFVLITANLFCDLSGILEVLHCILVESPEALNIIQRAHIKSIIYLLYKHGRNHKVGSQTSTIVKPGMWDIVFLYVIVLLNPKDEHNCYINL